MAPLNIYYQNARGLRTKTNIFLRNVYLNSYDIIAITESWLLDGIHDSELFDSRYMVWRRDRDYSRTQQKYGGGVLIAIRRDLSVIERIDWRSTAEDIWVTVTIRCKQTNTSLIIHVCVVYLCDENLGSPYKVQLNNFSSKLTDIFTCNPSDEFIILGDFNMADKVTWSSLSGCDELLPCNICGDHFVNFFDVLDSCGICQYNSVSNHMNRILDLVLSSSKVVVSSCDHPLVPEDTYHKSLCIQSNIMQLPELTYKPTTRYLFVRGDYNSICLELNEIDWISLFRDCALNEAVNLFYDKLYYLRDKYVPIKNVRFNYYPPWYSSALIKILKEKHKYHTKYKIYKSRTDYNTFSLLRERAERVERNCYDQYISKIEASIISNPKLFFSYVKGKSKSNSLPAVMRYSDQLVDSGEGISNLFAQYFHSTFRESGSNDMPYSETYSSSNSSNISSIEINKDEVLKLLKTLDLSKSAGPDLIPALFIVNCAESLVKPLCILFIRSIAEGVVPNIWKSAFITPIYKKGDKSNIENYRPISKLCLFAKIFEKIVYAQLYASLKCFFSEDQHGFLKNRSTVSNLILANEFITEGMENSGQVDVIYTDYSKCFDRIDHRVLLNKLLAAGIHGDLFRWFRSYVENRSQAVVVKGYTSSWTPIPSGVPQGSLLGPLLFIIFINDVNNCFLNSKVLLFADDMKILKTIVNSEDINDLQRDLSRFETYCDVNKLDLNVSKCYYMSFSRKNQVLDKGYIIRNLMISKINVIKDLGVFHDNKLLFDTHIDHIIKKANKALGFVMRSSKEFKNLKVIKVLYCTFVRSHLEYASQIWNPRYGIYKSRIEAIQRKFLKYLDFKARQYSVNYEHRCKRYHFLPLELRRDISDICYLMSIAKGSVNSSDLLSKIAIKHNQRSLRSKAKLHVPMIRTNYRRNSFLPRAIAAFNELPADVDLFCTSTTSLKRRLTKDYFT